MKMAFGLLADYAAQLEAGKLLIAGEFDSVTAPSTPVRHPSLFLIARLEGEATEKVGRVDIALRDEKGGLVEGVSATLPDVRLAPAVVPGTGRAQLVIGFTQVVFPGLGLYRFVISAQGNEIGTIPIMVRPAKAPAVADRR